MTRRDTWPLYTHRQALTNACTQAHTKQQNKTLLRLEEGSQEDKGTCKSQVRSGLDTILAKQHYNSECLFAVT